MGRDYPATQMHGPADTDRPKRLRDRLLTGLWIVLLAVSMASWIAALAWIAYLLIQLLL
jgi:hypothetical protein